MRIVISATKFGPDKNDVVVQELLEGGNWKQALANLEKKLKKGQDDRLVLNRALVLLSSDDRSRHLQGTHEVRKMLDRELPIVDLDVLNAIDQEGMVDHVGDAALTSMWERAQSAQPQNQLILSAWLSALFRRGNYLAAQKAATKAMIVAKDKRRRFFQAIACAYLACERPRGEIPEVERSMAESFAFKFLSAAAKRVTPDDDFVGTFGSLSLSKKETLLTEQATKPVDPSSTTLQKHRDLRFLIYVFRKQGRNAEALSILNDESRTGLQSAFAAGSWDLLIDKVKLLDVCAKWEELWNLCHSILLDAARDQSEESDVPTYAYGRIGDDFTIWRGLVRAAANIGTAQVASQTRNMLETFVSLNARSRFLARLEYELHPQNPTADRTNSLSSLSGHQTELRTTPSNFRDISSFTARISAHEKTMFLLESENYARNGSPGGRENPEAAAIKWVRSEINSLKLDYNLAVSNKHNLPNISLLESFAANCLRLYHISLRLELDLPVTDRRCGDDAAILVAMACIHLAYQGQSNALLQSISILEKLLVRSKHNYDAIILLIRLYLYQGAVSKAFELYYRLDIKNIQTQTLSWVLLTRISSIHPHASRKKRCDPLALLGECLGWGTEKIAMSAALIEKHLESDDAMALCENVKVINMLEDSFSRIAMFFESTSIRRRHGIKEKIVFRNLTSFIHNPPWRDVRDSAAVASYEHHGQPVMDQYIRPGPISSTVWVRLQLWLHEVGLCFEAGGKDVDIRASLQKLSDLYLSKDYFEGMHRTKFQMTSELTDSELQAYTAVLVLTQALTSMSHVSGHKTALSHGGKNEVPHYLSRVKKAERYVRNAVDYFDTMLMDASYWRGVTDRPRWMLESQRWEFFHKFHMSDGLATLFVRFLQTLIGFSIALRELSSGPPPEHPQSIYLSDTQQWRDLLNSTLRGLTETDCEARKAVDRLQSIYHGVEYAMQMSEAVLGDDLAEDISPEFRAALKLCLDEDFVIGCCKELAGSWTDCLEGISGSISRWGAK